MKSKIALSTASGLICWLLLISGCTGIPTVKHKSLDEQPETVLVTYHVRPGMEKQFEALLQRAWDTYRGEHMVKPGPHIVVRDAEENNTIGYVEIFTWSDHTKPQKAPDAVKKVWAEEQQMCEPRAGRPAIGGGEVDWVPLK